MTDASRHILNAPFISLYVFSSYLCAFSSVLLFLDIVLPRYFIVSCQMSLS